MSRRVALVTGGGRGVGREPALLLAAAGAHVMIAARSTAEPAAVGLEYVAADLGTPEGCALAAARRRADSESLPFAPDRGRSVSSHKQYRPANEPKS